MGHGAAVAGGVLGGLLNPIGAVGTAASAVGVGSAATALDPLGIGVTPAAAVGVSKAKSMMTPSVPATVVPGDAPTPSSTQTQQQQALDDEKQARGRAATYFSSGANGNTRNLFARSLLAS